MTVDPIQRDLNARFAYRADTGESWRILKDVGQVWGDCEDYGLTLIWLLEGGFDLIANPENRTVLRECIVMLRFWLALISCKYVLWQCQSPNGVGHVVLWCRGYGWTDNMMQRQMTRAELKRLGYRLQFPWPVPMVALKFIARPLLRLL